MSFRRRNYPEVLDNLLTTLVGGVAAEAHPFPPSDSGPQNHPLEQPPVREIVSVYGIHNGEQQIFRNGNDYRLGSDKQTLSWVGDGNLPDPGTLVYINYLREGVVPTLTDLQVGSVARTMTESIALEMARLYAQMEAVYKSGFIDTAGGSSLDKVVALLDVHRFKGNRPSTKLRFSRVTGAAGSITIQAGARVIDEQAKFEYETTETVTMSDNQNSIMVTARDLESANEPVAAATLTILTVPIAGISGVTNPGPASRAAADETDVELRTRAKNFLHGSERATRGALDQVLIENGISGDIDDESQPGRIFVTPHGEALSPEQLLKLETELQATRPAGVQLIMRLPLAPLAVDLGVQLTTKPKTVEADLRAAHNQVTESIRSYFDALDTDADASINQLVGLVLAIPNVDDIRIESATTNESGSSSDRLDIAAGVIQLRGQPTRLGQLVVADPNLPTELDLVISFPAASQPPLQAGIETAVTQAVSYWNSLGQVAFDPSDSLEVQKRLLSFNKLLRLVPLPGHVPDSLQDYDATPDPTLLPQAADRAPYSVNLTISQASGLTETLALDDAAYTLSPAERLLLNSVVIAVEEG
ncbi:MAG: hypothetical protein GY802_01370 [Gammaproteobacteria bacterium]|nr:hypothetical protein [Gammaproteobacteria bacterium]